MVPKKSKKANLEKKKNSFLQLGFIVAISFTLVAFEWSTDEFPSNEIASALKGELSPEIINEVQFSKPQAPKPISSRKSIKDPSEVIVTEEPSLEFEKQTKEIFEEVDLSEFIEEGIGDSIIHEDFVCGIPVNAGADGFDGVLPHYIECDGLDSDKMFACISKQIGIKLPANSNNVKSLRFTGKKKVTATFTVDEFGNVSQVYVHSEKKFEKDLVREVKRAIFELPQMIPGSQGDAPIKVRFTLPINFTIQ